MSHPRTRLPRLSALLLPALLPLLLAGCANERLLGVNYVPEKLERDRNPAEKLFYYFVNRGLDFVDMFTLNAGFGPTLHAEAHFTNALRFGVGGSYLASIGTGEAPRQIGLFGRGAAELSLGPLQWGVIHYNPHLATKLQYDESWMDLRLPSEQLYRKQRDYWAIGGSWGLIYVGWQAEFHPLQFFDFMAGLMTFDPLQDDI
jgi:hypothetical protein